MITPRLLASTIAFLAAASGAFAQAALGTPVIGTPQTPMRHAGCAPADSYGTYSPAEFSAAQIMFDEGQAIARRAAVRFLGTVDCRHCREAELGLIASLRADRIESVRYEAALAIASMHSATPRLVEALSITAQGNDGDGNPAETSERVRMTARAALSRFQSALAPTGSWAPERDRDAARTVSAQTPVPIDASSPFMAPSLFHVFLRLADRRDRHTNDGADSRLRGLSPLGSEVNLAIPSVYPPHR